MTQKFKPQNSPGLSMIKRLWDVLDERVRCMRAPPLNLQDLKDLLNILVPDTTSHLQRSCVVHAWTGQSCFAITRGTYCTWFNVMVDRVQFYLFYSPPSASKRWYFVSFCVMGGSSGGFYLYFYALHEFKHTDLYMTRTYRSISSCPIKTFNTLSGTFVTFCRNLSRP